MKAQRCSVVASALLWAGAIIAAEPSTEPRQFQLDLPPAVVDPDGVPVNLPKWVRDNRVPRVNWSPDHRVGMYLIDETPDPAPGGDPLTLIRAANHLHEMGKKEAISVLRDYAARNYGTGDWRLAPIVQLLFSPIDPEDILPPREWYDLEQETWRVQSVGIVVSGDIPFYVFDGFTLGGWSPPTTVLVEWAARHGRFRIKPLGPTTKPKVAADQVLEAVAKNAAVKRSFGSEESFQQFVDELRPRLQKQASLATAR